MRTNDNPNKRGKLWTRFRTRAQRATAFITVIVFTSICTVMLGSVMQWTGTHVKLVYRYNEYVRAQYVAEAGVEKTFSSLRSFLNTMGRAPNQTDVDNMATLSLPTSSDNGSFSSYRYVTTSGQMDKITATVSGTATSQVITVGSYAGLNGLVLPYQITSRVNSVGRPIKLTTGIQREIQFQSIPIFQFAVFYNMDLEIENGPPMIITGRVHSNGKGYFAPDTSLTFQSAVTVVKNIYATPIPGDTHKSSWNDPDYATPPTQSAGALNLPLFAGSGTSTPHDLLELPPASGTDPIASDRLYNKAGLRVKVFNGGTYTATDNAGNSTTLSSAIINTTKKLYNFRENATITVTEIDIAQLMSAGKVPANGIVYVDDVRTTGVSETAVRLVNGTNLPSQGLTVVTPNPIYIQGNYNTSGATESAAIMADSINILSGSWNDANSSKSLSNRIASNTTVNAAFFSGIVPTSGNNYSGGLENFPRFLEDWTGKTFTYTGSMVVMFVSETATGLWGNSSYVPPNRNWAFDVQFLDPTRLPPGCPSVLTLARAAWHDVP